jgi:hypothetical protein
MNQFPYGTSGVCPNTVSPLQEGIAAMEEYHEYLEDQHLTFSNPHNRNGYIEGYVESTSLGPCVLRISGEEIVYNFERGESQKFTYREVRLSDYFDIDSELAMPGLTFSLLGGGQKMFYAGVLSGFTGRRTTESEYSGYFVGTNLGASIGPPLKIKEETLPVATNVTVGWGQFTGTNLFDDVVIVSGDFMYWGGAASGGTGRVDLPIDASATGTIYQPDGPAKQYDDKINLLRDIRDGYSSPIPSPGIFNTTLRKHGVRVGLNVFIRKGWIDTFRAKEVYSELYGD